MEDGIGAHAPTYEPANHVVSVRDVEGNEVRVSVLPLASAAANGGPWLRPPPAADVISHGELSVDLATREVTVAEGPVQLTRREFDLLAFMASNPRRVFSKAQLLQNVWSSDIAWQSEATVTEHIRRLRRKLGYRKDAQYGISTVWGVGYRFVP